CSSIVQWGGRPLGALLSKGVLNEEAATLIK
ncbi:MAG: hypothetical protein ACI8RD_010071, partial [Bacillariaceae sp.]